MFRQAAHPEAAKPAGIERLLEPRFLFWALLLHGLLAVAMRLTSVVSTVHAVLTLLAGIGVALFSRRPEYAAYAAGYVAACEVLWRMTRGTLVWEHGKYALLAILLAGLCKFRKIGQPLAGLQFLLLVPSAMLPFSALPFAQVTDVLSFNLSGPLALCISVIYMAHMRWTASQLYTLLILMVCPLCGIAALTVYNMQTVANLSFNGASNYLITGGFGPNQVAAALGLGTVLAFILIMSAPLKPAAKLILSGALLLMIGQSIMTFSRNGIYSAVFACFAGAPFLVSDRRARMQILVGAPVVILVFLFVVFPVLDGITDGKLSNRLQVTDSSHRDEIAFREIDIWMENFVMGVGPGMGMYLRGDLWDAAAHTEFSRLLAEHGLLGFGALLLYPALFMNVFRDASGPLHKGLVVCCMAWAVCFMAVNAMRLAAPGFVFGMACVGLNLNAAARRRPVAPAAAARRPERGQLQYPPAGGRIPGAAFGAD